MSDGLTGIANRRCFDQRLLTEWELHREAGQSLALLLMDVDCFKALNDACGHLHGDDCLRLLAKLCDEAAPDSQTLVARYGGEEFVLLPRCDLPTACRHGEALRRRVEELAIPHPASLVALHLTISIGVSATCPDADQLCTCLTDDFHVGILGVQHVPDIERPTSSKTGTAVATAAAVMGSRVCRTAGFARLAGDPASAASHSWRR